MLHWVMMIFLALTTPISTRSGEFLALGAPPMTPVPPQAAMYIDVGLDVDESGVYIVDPATMDGRYDLIVRLSGVEAPPDPPHAVRAAQFFIEFTVAPDEGQDPSFVVLGFEPGGPGSSQDGDASPMQVEIATLLELPEDPAQPATIGYAVGVAPELPIATEDCALATIAFQAVAPGTMTLWFRDPGILPTTMLADDDGQALVPPALVLTPADAAQAIRIRFDGASLQDPETEPTDTDPPPDQSLNPNSPSDSLADEERPGGSTDAEGSPAPLALEEFCGTGTCGAVSPTCVPLLLLSRLRFPRRSHRRQSTV